MPQTSTRRRLPVAILFVVLAAGCCIPDSGMGWIGASFWSLAGATWVMAATRQAARRRRRSGRVRTGVVVQPLAMMALSIPGIVVLGERIVEGPGVREVLSAMLSWPAPPVAAICGIALYRSVQQGLHRPAKADESGYFYRSSYGA